MNMNISTFIESLLRRLRRAHLVAADRHLLAQMNTHQLRDIGLDSHPQAYARKLRMGWTAC